MRSILAVICCLLVACTTVRDQTRALNGAVADTVTTGVALRKAGVIESNPIGFPATILLKGIILGYLHYYPNEALDRAAGSIWWAAAANNISVIVGASNPLSLLVGLSVGVGLWLNSDEIDD